MNRSAKISICRVANFNFLEICWWMKNSIKFLHFWFLFQVCFLVAVLGVNFLLVPMRPGRWNFYCFLQPSENWPGRKSEWETTYDIFLAVSSSFQGDFQSLFGFGRKLLWNLPSGLILFSRLSDLLSIVLVLRQYGLQTSLFWWTWKIIAVSNHKLRWRQKQNVEKWH